MVAGIVITGRGTARSNRVRRAKSFGIAGGISSRFGGAAKAAWHSTIMGNPTAPVAAAHLIEREIRDRVPQQYGKESFSEIDRKALSTADRELIRLPINSQ
jgi:hypothetical protein